MLLLVLLLIYYGFVLFSLWFRYFLTLLFFFIRLASFRVQDRLSMRRTITQRMRLAKTRIRACQRNNSQVKKTTYGQVHAGRALCVWRRLNGSERLKRFLLGRVQRIEWCEQRVFVFSILREVPEVSYSVFRLGGSLNEFVGSVRFIF